MPHNLLILKTIIKELHNFKSVESIYIKPVESQLGLLYYLQQGIYMVSNSNVCVFEIICGGFFY
jgi:hypothetical protein